MNAFLKIVFSIKKKSLDLNNKVSKFENPF